VKDYVIIFSRSDSHVIIKLAKCVVDANVKTHEDNYPMTHFVPVVSFFVLR